MPQATFWFASPFRDWIGQRSLTLAWEGSLTLRGVLERLADAHPALRANLPPEGLQDDTLNQMAAFILEGDFLSLDSPIPDGARVDVLTPLAGGTARGCDPRHTPRFRQGDRVTLILPDDPHLLPGSSHA